MDTHPAGDGRPSTSGHHERRLLAELDAAYGPPPVAEASWTLSQPCQPATPQRPR